MRIVAINRPSTIPCWRFEQHSPRNTARRIAFDLPWGKQFHGQGSSRWKTPSLGTFLPDFATQLRHNLAVNIVWTVTVLQLVLPEIIKATATAAGTHFRSEVGNCIINKSKLWSIIFHIITSVCCVLFLSTECLVHVQLWLFVEFYNEQ